MDKFSVPPTPPPSSVSVGGIRLFTGSPFAWADYGFNRQRLTKLSKPGYPVVRFLKRLRIPTERKRMRQLRVMKSENMATNSTVPQGSMRRRCFKRSLKRRTWPRDARYSPLWYTRVIEYQRCRMQLRVLLQQFINLSHQTALLTPFRKKRSGISTAVYYDYL